MKELGKQSLTMLNLLIILSIFILPALIYVSAINVAGVVTSIKIANPTQSFNGSKLTVSYILIVGNPGYFDVNAGLTASINGDQGTWVGVVGPKLLIPAGSKVQNIPLAVEFDVSQISEDDLKRLAFNSESFTFEVSAHADMPPITSLGIDVSAQLDWLPPIHNLTFGTPSVREVNSTRITLENPISFENQSLFFAVDGSGVIRLYNSTDQQVGEGTISISAQPGAKGESSAMITVSLPTDVGSLMLKDETFRYRVDADIDLKGLPVKLNGLSQSFELVWGAPLKDPKFSTSISALNSTHMNVIGTLTFLNNNRFLSLDGAITPKLVNGFGEVLLGKEKQFHVTPGETATLSEEVTVPNIKLLEGGWKLVLGIDTSIGSYDLEAGSIG